MEPLTPAQQEQVDNIRKALEEEFAQSRSDEMLTTALKDIEDLKGDALKVLRREMRHGDSANLRVKIAMWAYDHMVDQAKVSTSPLEEFTAGLLELEKARDARAT